MFSLSPERGARLLVLARRNLGDLPGHEFHGNQWTEGGIDAVSMSQVFQVDTKANDEILARESGDEKTHITEVHIEDLIATQSLVYPATIKKYVNPLTKGKDKILVWRMNGKLYIGDGHHRIAAAKLRGERTIRVPVATIRDESRSIRGASVKSPLHTSADLHAPRLAVALRHAFTVARLSLRRKLDADRAIVAMKNALDATLEPLLMKAVVAGGEVGAGGLRTLGDLPGHEFHGNQWTSGGAQVEPTVSGNWVTFKTDSGALEAKLKQDDKVLQVKEASVKKSERGKGEGVRLYESALVHAQKEGLSLHSDVAVSVSADRVWDSLKRRGYEVVRAEKTELDTSLNKFYAIKEVDHPAGGAKIKVRTGEPVWRSLESRILAKKPRKVVGPIELIFNAVSPDVIDWVKNHVAELITNITDTSRERIRAAIANRIETGEQSIDEILTAVGDEDRAELIARHETMLASNEGQRQAWDQAVEEGLMPEDAERVWIATADELTCPICGELDGEKAPLDGEYPGGYDGPPAHVQCRCTEGIA